MTGNFLLPFGPELSGMFFGLVAYGAVTVTIGEYLSRKNADRIVSNAIERRNRRLVDENRSKYGHGVSDDPRLGLYSLE